MNSQAESLGKACKDLTLKEPFYGLFLMSLNKHWSDQIPTACVALRGINVELHINPEFWTILMPKQQIGLLKHELLHIAFFHMTTDYSHLEDQKLLNIAMDIEINQYIDAEFLPPSPQLPSSYPELNLELKAGTIYYYEKLLEQKQKSNEIIKALLDAMAEGKSSCKLPDGTKVDLPNHDWEEIQDTDEATQKLIKAQVAHVMNQAADQVKASAGTLPGAIEEILKRINTMEPPKFDWRGYIRRFNGKSVKTYTKKSRRKFNKRTPDFPGLKIKQQKHILAAIDTSGSVNTEELAEFLQEIHHMYKTGSEVTICQCDTAIHKLGKYNPREDLSIHGRGGTSFQPVIDYFNEHHHLYSCLIYLTDGEASVPQNARGSILWVLSSVSSMNKDLPGAVIQLN